MPDIEDNPDLKHFLKVATSNSGSSGNVGAKALAACLVDNVPRLDASALRGMCVFAGLAKMAPETARNMLQD